jgi:hypothetical protein
MWLAAVQWLEEEKVRCYLRNKEKLSLPTDDFKEHSTSFFYLLPFGDLVYWSC